MSTYPCGVAISVSGIIPKQLRYWLDFGLAKFDAHDARKKGKHRRFSETDILRIAIIGRLVTCGFTVKDASATVEQFLRQKQKDILSIERDCVLIAVNVLKLRTIILLRLQGQCN